MQNIENGLFTSDGTKVFTVEEYDNFVVSIPKRYQPMFKVDVITGLRYIELQRLHDNPDWYKDKRNQIILPPEAQLKVKQKLAKRTIDKLPNMFPELFDKFISGKRPPNRVSWNQDLERWSEKIGIYPKVTPKTPRKTIESWMLKAGIPEYEVFARSGHDVKTSMLHYQSLSFTDYEMRDIENRLKEWGILK